MKSKDTTAFRQIGFAFLLFLGLDMAISIALSFPVQNIMPGIVQEDWFIWVFNYGIMYLICFPIFLLYIRRVPDTYREIPLPEPKRISLPLFLLIALCSYGCMQAINIGSNLIRVLMEVFIGKPIGNPLEQVVAASSVWINLLVVVVVAPIMEELIFRGLLYKKLIGYGPKVYILLSAVLFMIYHVNLFQMGYAFLLGLVFAGMAAYTGTIKYGIALHMLINFVGSGIGVLILAYGTQMTLIIFGIIVIMVAFTGFATAIVVGILNLRKISFGYDTVLPLPDKKRVFLNAGMIALVVLCILLLLYTHVAPLMSLSIE